MRFGASIDVRSLERIRLLAVELEALERRMTDSLGERSLFARELHAIRARFLVDLMGDKPTEEK